MKNGFNVAQETSTEKEIKAIILGKTRRPVKHIKTVDQVKYAKYETSKRVQEINPTRKKHLNLDRQ